MKQSYIRPELNVFCIVDTDLIRTSAEVDTCAEHDNLGEWKGGWNTEVSQ